MTMLTRCAACGTAFRITTDQLVSRQGRVRCGRCGEVFNALDRLVPDPSGEHAATDTQRDSALEEVPPLPDEAEPSYDLFDTSGVESEVPPAPTPSTVLASNSILHDSPPSRHGFPWWSTIGSAFAVVALLVQSAYHYRDQIAVQYPQARPLFEYACSQLGCRVSTPVDPQAISIESHDLQADNGNRAVLILSAVLRNRASYSQRLPMLELSLIDAVDTPVARRVLAPADYANPAGPQAIAASSEVQVRVFLDAAQVKASGYRLYAFYP